MYFYQPLFHKRSQLHFVVIDEPLPFLSDYRQGKYYPTSKDVMFWGAWLNPGPLLGLKWEDLSCKRCFV